MTTRSTTSGRRRHSSSSAEPDLVRPRYLHIPEYERTLGPEVAAVATLAGFPPDPEQRMLLDAAFAIDKKGRSVAFEVVVIAPRQNLKTGFFKQVALGQLFVRDERLVVWSAHEFEIANEATNDLEALIEGSDILRRRVRLTARGSVASHGAVPQIVLLSGARLRFKTRTSGGGRGLSGRKVILDEGYALQPGQIGALMPIMLAQPDPQVFIGSSACRPESGVLGDIVKRGRSGLDRRMVYAEWCAPDPSEACKSGDLCSHSRDIPGCGCDKPELLMKVHSAITRGRIQLDTVMDMRRTMPPEEYGREVMGWHDETVEGLTAVSFEQWKRAEDPGSSCEPGCFAVEVSLDRAWGSIGVAGPYGDRTHVEVAVRDRGTGWIVDRCVDLDGSHGHPLFVVDGGGPAASFIPELEKAGLWVTVADTKDVAAAYAGLVDGLDQGALSHGPQADVDQAVLSGLARSVGDGALALGRKASGVDITPLVSIALALWGFQTFGTPLAPEDVFIG